MNELNEIDTFAWNYHRKWKKLTFKKKTKIKAIGEICAYARGTTTKQYYLAYNTARPVWLCAIHIRFQSQSVNYISLSHSLGMCVCIRCPLEEHTTILTICKTVITYTFTMWMFDFRVNTQFSWSTTIWLSSLIVIIKIILHRDRPHTPSTYMQFFRSLYIRKSYAKRRQRYYRIATFDWIEMKVSSILQ